MQVNGHNSTQMNTAKEQPERVRVFISSVQKELEVERVAIAGAVSSDRRLGEVCEIVLYEKEALSGRRVAKPYLECLESCHIYILLIDREYSGGATGTISATHEEYRHAMRRNMPALMFVRGRHDTERQKETQAFFDEIRKDGNRYQRFHDRIDLLPEVQRGIERILEESFGTKIGHDAKESEGQVGKSSPFEQQVLDVRDTALSIEVARQWLRATKVIAEGEDPAPRAILNMLREKGLVRKEQKGSFYKAMASGLLFFGKDPAATFPQCRVLVDAYAGTEPDASPKDQETLSGPASTIVDRVIEFVMRNTRHPIRVVGIRRLTLDEYPRAVIREAIVNAIAHRDYEDSARPIYVKVLFDRVEILSPGNLLPPLTLSKLVKGKYEPCSRNPTLAQYLGHLRLMEQRGSGIRRMHSAMVDHGLKGPEYAFRDGYFTVTLRGPGDDIERVRVPTTAGAPVSEEERLTERQREIVGWLAAGETMTNRKCQDRLSVSKVTAMKDLSALVEIGLAERTGKGRSVRYIYGGGNR